MLWQFQLTTFPPQSCSPMCGWQITSEGMQKDLHLCVWHLSLARRLLARPSMALCTSILFHTVSGTQQEISPLLHMLFLVFWHEKSKYISQSLAISAASPSLTIVISTVACAKKNLAKQTSKKGAKEMERRISACLRLPFYSAEKQGREKTALLNSCFAQDYFYLLLPAKRRLSLDSF